MNIHWNKVEIDELTRSGGIYFNARMEMLEGLPCKMYRLHAQHSLWTHCHDYFQIWYIAKGSFTHKVNDEAYQICKGDAFVIPPFTLHSLDIDSGVELEIFGCEFMPSFVNERLESMPTRADFFDVAFLEFFLRQDTGLHSKISLDNAAELTVKNLMKEMLAEYEKRHPFFQLVLKAHLLQLLSVLIRQLNGELVQAVFEKSEKYRKIMNRVVDYIRNHYHENLNLNTLCTVSALSRSMFCGLFKEWTGKTFNRYVTDLRISQAKAMLKQLELSVTDVCYSVGFNEPSYFCRIFKKYTGISPSEFRKHAIK